MLPYIIKNRISILLIKELTTAKYTRMRAVPPRLHKPSVTIFLKIRNQFEIPKFEKSFPLVCRACQVKSIDI